MLFNSLGYLIFLPVVVTLFWLSPAKLRTALLLGASYIFYMTWKPIYGLLIFALTLLNYLFGRIIAGPSPKKLWLFTAIGANLLVLAFFKYAYFAFDLADRAAHAAGKALPAIPWQIILPLGISFFVFEFIHYVVDVYKGGKPIKSFVDFALFASFFPTQIAGPIKRYQDFIPQLARRAQFDIKNLDDGVALILFGLFKKVLFADNLAVVVQSAYAHPEILTGLDLWLATYAFAFQIYFDFSGYTDIARGSAQLLGYKVPPNFNLPYLSSSISEFWRRWHISLSSWLRDYLFIPLGGSKGGSLLNYRNLFITMVLGGLWHGAAMHFVAWGAYQGVMLIVHKLFVKARENVTWLSNFLASRLGHCLSIILTFHVVCIGWVFFRAETTTSALLILHKLLFLPQGLSSSIALSLPSTSDPVIFMILPLVLAALAAGQLIAAKFPEDTQGMPLPGLWKAAFIAAAACLLMVFSPDTSPKFIYFQF